MLASALSCASGTAVSAGESGVVRAPVPIISQASSHSCGAAALMATLIYFGVFDGPESELHAPLAVTPEQGTHPDRIVAVARERGLTADKRTGLTLADVERALAQGAVVILAIQAWPEQSHRDAGAWEASWEDGHYVVAVGLDDRNVYVMDPSVRGSYGFIPRAELLRRWHDFEESPAGGAWSTTAWASSSAARPPSAASPKRPCASSDVESRCWALIWR